MNYLAPKIFIVEDDALYAEMVVHKLASHRFGNVQVFNSGEAFEQHLHQMPDIVLLDYHLGDADGVAILKKIKAFNPNIQVILLSAQDRMEVAVSSLKYGAFDYLEKNEESFTKLVHLIGRICLLNEELQQQSKRSIFQGRLKKVAVGISLFLTGLMLLSIL
ncbi:MAG: response regulator [Flammeovirgaceae bacterium]